MGYLRRKLPVSRAFFYVSLGFPSKSSPDRKISPLSQSPWERSTPSMFPKMGPLQKQMPVSRALFNLSFRVPSKEALPPGSPHRGPTEEDAPFPEPSFICLSKSLVNNSPLSGCPLGPLWREMSISRAFLYTSFRIASKAAPTPGSHNRAPFPEPTVIYISQSMVEEPPRFPNGDSMDRDARFQSLLLHTSPEKNKISPFSPSPW
jgi:hypothetical protein